MADVYVRAGAVYRDDRGLVSTVSFLIHGDGANVNEAQDNARSYAGDLFDAVDDLTNAIRARGTGILNNAQTYNPAYGANAAYESCSQGAEMVFRDDFGGTHRYVIPAPKETIFQADGVTVDSLDSLMLVFIPLVTSHVTTPAGTAVSTFVGGRFRSIQRKAERIGLKTPALT